MPKKDWKMVLIILSIVGVVFLIMAIPMSFLFYRAIEEQMDKDDFLQNGKRGKAKVLKLVDRSHEISKPTRLYADLFLEVSVPNYKTYQVKTYQIISVIHAPRVQPGLTIDVLADPEQPNNTRRILLLLEEDALEKEKNRR